MSTTTRTIDDAQVTAGRRATATAEPDVATGRGAALDRATAVWIALLVLGVATDRLGVPVGGFNLRLEFIIGGVAAALALLRQGRSALRLVGLVDICLGVWLAVNLVSSLLFSPDTKDSLKYVAILAGLMAIYVAARLLIRPGAALEWAVVTFVGAGAAIALLGLLSAFLFQLIGPNFGILLERFYNNDIFVVTPKVQSLLWEPNIFGSFALAECTLASILVLIRLRGGATYDINRLPLPVLYVAVGLGMCGVMLSMTRTVWLIGPPLIALMAIVAWRLRLAGARVIAASMLLPSLVGGAVGLGVGLSLPAPQWQMGRPWDLTPAQIDDMVRENLFGSKTTAGTQAKPTPGARPTTTGGAASPTATPEPVGQSSAAANRIEEVLGDPGQAPSLAGRLRVFTDAFDGWLKRPLLGWGAGAFPLVYPPPPEGGSWIANIELHALFDTGIVGLILLATAALAAGWRAFKAIRYPTGQWGTQSYLTFGLLSAGVGLMAAYQVTDGSWLGFTWVLLAMLVAGGNVASDE